MQDILKMITRVDDPLTLITTLRLHDDLFDIKCSRMYERDSLSRHLEGDYPYNQIMEELIVDYISQLRERLAKALGKES